MFLVYCFERILTVCIPAFLCESLCGLSDDFTKSFFGFNRMSVLIEDFLFLNFHLSVDFTKSFYVLNRVSVLTKFYFIEITVHVFVESVLHTILK